MMNAECRMKTGRTGSRAVPGASLQSLAFSSSFCILHSSFCIPLAHGGEPQNLRDLLTTWGWEPLPLAGLALSALLYAVGVRNVWRAAGRAGAGVRKWEAACFAG